MRVSAVLSSAGGFPCMITYCEYLVLLINWVIRYLHRMLWAPCKPYHHLIDWAPAWWHVCGSEVIDQHKYYRLKLLISYGVVVLVPILRAAIYKYITEFAQIESIPLESVRNNGADVAGREVVWASGGVYYVDSVDNGEERGHPSSLGSCAIVYLGSMRLMVS